MIRRTLLSIGILFILLLSMPSNAQQQVIETRKPRLMFQMGGQLSLNVCTMSGAEFVENNAFGSISEELDGIYISPGVGFFSNFFLNNSVSMAIELKYQPTGARYKRLETTPHELGITTSNRYVTDMLHYVAFPISINYYPVHSFYVQGGGYLSTLAGATRKDPEYVSDWDYQNGRYSIEKDFSNSDAGFIAGIGYDTYLLRVGLSYQQSLVNISNNVERDIRNRVFQFSLTIKFRDTRNPRKVRSFN